MSHPLHCFICEDILDNGSEIKVVKQKGINGLMARSKLKKDDKWKCLQDLTQVTVHEKCRTSYNLSKKQVSDTAAPEPLPGPPFSFRADCFLCAKPWDPKHQPGRQVCTPNAQECVQKLIALHSDEWSEKVKRRIEGKCLMEENARYHISCYNKFRLRATNNPGETPRLSDLEDAFDGAFKYMETSDDCQFTFKELLDKMEGPWKPAAATLKQRLINKYGTEIFMLERPPKPTIICFRNTGFKILQTFWTEQKAENEEDERLRIVRAAAAIIREDIRSQVYETSSFPCPEELFQNVKSDIPKTLLALLDTVLLSGKKTTKSKLTPKRDSIAHAIISTVRPRSFISSIQLATGVYLNRKFGSRLIIDVLDKLGFCTSYTNVSLYEASAILSCDKKIENNAYIQHVFDNADHNVCTIDGFNTFHSMGGICCVTAKTGVSTEGVIKKLTGVPKAQELAAKYNIPVICCQRIDNTKTGLKSITFVDVSQLLLGDRDKLPAAYPIEKIGYVKCVASTRFRHRTDVAPT